MASILRAYSVVCLEWVLCAFDVYAFSHLKDVVLSSWSFRSIYSSGSFDWSLSFN
jgi:hypothetical protein